MGNFGAHREKGAYFLCVGMDLQNRTNPLSLPEGQTAFVLCGDAP